MKEVLKRYAKMQREKKMPCPRCGEDSMRQPVHTNALSRHADIYICSQCGMDEAIRDFMHSVLPEEEWEAVRNEPELE